MKITMTFTIDSQMAEKFKKIAKDKFINKSKLIESLIEMWIKENATKEK
jgi:metal-responsive CopG/Arc/MetJ family transcriptional regulator